MTDPSFSVYIDESGCEGDKYGTGSSEFMVLAAVVFPHALDRIQDALFRDAGILLYRRPDYRFKRFTELPDKCRHVLTSLLAQCDTQIAYVLVHKPSIVKRQFLKNHGDLYFFLTKFLIQRISWICEDDRHPYGPGDGSPEIFFSERKSLRYDDFRAYVRRLKTKLGHYGVRAAWSLIQPEQSYAFPHSKLPGLRIADIAAGALAIAIERKQFGMTDDRFIRTLRPVVYDCQRHVGPQRWLHLWPRDALPLLCEDPRFGWLRYFE